MAYPLTCVAGYNAPAKRGKFEITGISAAVSDMTKDAEIAIVDDSAIKDDWVTGRFLTSLTDVKTILCDVKTLASTDGQLSYEFAEPIKTRYGVSVLTTNIKSGTFCVYVR